MRRTALLAATALAFLLAACGGLGGSEPAAVVRFVTPAATPTPTSPPTATPTPLPPTELILSTTQTSQAGTTLASVTGGVVSGQITFLGRSFDLTQGEQSMYAYVPVATDDTPGTYPLQASFTRLDGSTGSLTADITVLATEWTVESLEFGPELEHLLSPELEASEAAVMAGAYAASTEEKLWDSWVQPVEGTLTSPYGERRAANGGEPEGHHRGVDIGAEEGAPVVAASAGRVVFARTLDIRGNTVIIDHGGGVLSGYSHLGAFSVAEGDVVETGQQIGAVGTTGRSTGAHLHWEMSVDGVLVDAFRFVDGRNGF